MNIPGQIFLQLFSMEIGIRYLFISVIDILLVIKCTEKCITEDT